VRRGECLFSLIAIHHAASDPANEGKHTNGVVGSNTLRLAYRKLVEAGRLRLSTYTTHDEVQERYFKNKLGGLGQYYLGALRELDILSGNSRMGLKYKKKHGRKLADLFGGCGNHEALSEAIEGDEVTISTLDALLAFCPCGLDANEPEREYLCDLLFDADEEFDLEGRRRRNSLALVLDLARNLPGHPAPTGMLALDQGAFRNCSYCGALPDGTAWDVPVELEAARVGWATYQRNELLSVALQGLFWAVLTQLQRDDLSLASVAECERWFCETIVPSIGELDGNSRFSTAVSTARKALPNLKEAWEPTHEIQLAQQFVDMAARADNSVAQIVAGAASVIVALAARGGEVDDSYSGFVHEPGYLDAYPINLRNFDTNSRSLWTDMTLGEVLGWLVRRWCLDVHFSVALRKLRHQTTDTFKIRPEDGGLRVCAVPPVPVFTNPRFRQALRALLDLGVLAQDANGNVSVTTRGESVMQGLGHA